MSEFIVLGLIPGTDEQLTFTIWLLGTLLPLPFIIVWKIVRSSWVRASIVGIRLAFAVRRLYA
jgi:hypothetical protein